MAARLAKVIVGYSAIYASAYYGFSTYKSIDWKSIKNINHTQHGKKGIIAIVTTWPALLIYNTIKKRAKYEFQLFELLDAIENNNVDMFYKTNVLYKRDKYSTYEYIKYLSTYVLQNMDTTHDPTILATTQTESIYYNPMRYYNHIIERENNVNQFRISSLLCVSVIAIMHNLYDLNFPVRYVNYKNIIEKIPHMFIVANLFRFGYLFTM